MRKLNYLLGVVLVATALTSCEKEKEKETEKEVTSISLDKPTLSLEIGEWQTLTAKVLPENATNKSATWLSHNPAIASVTDGVVFGNMAGTTTIIAKAGNYTATCEVTVKQFSLVGTNWRGVWNNEVLLKFTSPTDCIMTHYYPNMDVNLRGTYTLNSPNISMSLCSDVNGRWFTFSGTIIDNQMTLLEGSNVVVLTKQ